MGMSGQVHEKTDKIGTWAYHSVDGFYLSTLPEHYRMHRCHIKTTRNKQFTDTVHCIHRKITRPTITHADTVMAAIAECAKSINNLCNGSGANKMQQLVQITEREIHQKLAIAATPTTTASDPEISRVPLNNNTIKPWQTRSMTHPTQNILTVSTPVVIRVEQSTVAKHKIIKENYTTKKTCDKYNSTSAKHKIKNTAGQNATIQKDMSTHTVNENGK